MTQIFRCLRHHQLAGTKYFTLIVYSQLIPLDAFVCSEYIRYYTIVSCDQTIGKEYVVLPADSFSCSVCWPAWKRAHSEIMLIHLAHLHKIFLMSQPRRWNCCKLLRFKFLVEDRQANRRQLSQNTVAAAKRVKRKLHWVVIVSLSSILASEVLGYWSATPDKHKNISHKWMALFKRMIKVKLSSLSQVLHGLETLPLKITSLIKVKCLYTKQWNGQSNAIKSQ